MSPTAAMNVVAVIRLTPGTVMSRLIAREPSRVLGDATFDERDLGVEVVDLAQASVDGFAFVGGQFELGQPHAAAAPEQLAHRRSPLERSRDYKRGEELGAPVHGRGDSYG